MENRLIKILKEIKDKSMIKYNIEKNSPLEIDMEFILKELLEFIKYAGLEDMDSFTEDELDEFVIFYTQRFEVNSIVPIENCLYILYILFDFQVN